MSTTAPKLLKFANESSTSDRHVAGAQPPGRPLKSAMADTARTSGGLAGEKVAASLAEFPAATTTVTPAATARLMAKSMAALTHSQPKLMFATSMLAAFAVT